MRSAKQIDASRANGQKSAGPATPEGKANSRYNALKHGIFAEAQVMFDESAEDLAAFTEEMHAQYNPANPAERFLVDTLIHNEWRLRRYRNVEAGLWERARQIYLFNFTHREKLPLGDVYVEIAPDLDRLQRQVNACERNYHKALKELNNLQAAHSKTASESLGSFRDTSGKPAEGLTQTPTETAVETSADMPAAGATQHPEEQYCTAAVIQPDISPQAAHC